MDKILHEASQFHADVVAELRENIRCLEAQIQDLQANNSISDLKVNEMLKKAFLLVTRKDRLLARLTRRGSGLQLQLAAIENRSFDSFLAELRELNESHSKNEACEDLDVATLSPNNEQNDETTLDDLQSESTEKSSTSTCTSRAAEETRFDYTQPTDEKRSKRDEWMTTESSLGKNSIAAASDIRESSRKMTNGGWLNAKSKQTKLNIAAFKQPQPVPSRGSLTPSSSKLANNSVSSASCSQPKTAFGSLGETQKSNFGESSRSVPAEGETSRKRLALASPSSEGQPLNESTLPTSRRKSPHLDDAVVKHPGEQQPVSARVHDHQQQQQRSSARRSTDDDGLFGCETFGDNLSTSVLKACGFVLEKAIDLNETQMTDSDVCDAVAPGPALAASTQMRRDTFFDSLLSAPPKRLSLPADKSVGTESKRSPTSKNVIELEDVKHSNVQQKPIDQNRNLGASVETVSSASASSDRHSSSRSAPKFVSDNVPRFSNSNTNSNSNEPAYKYYETSRKRSEREQHAAFTCKECDQYYKSLGLNDNERRERLSSCSRHRARFEVPSTPEGFWSLDIPSTPPAERFEFEERKRKLEAARSARNRATEGDTSLGLVGSNSTNRPALGREPK